LMFSPQGSRAFLGTNKGLLGTKGLMILTPGSASAAGSIAQVNTASGKVLAVSPNGNFVLMANTAETPNQVFVVNATGTPATTALAIDNARAGAFSPDGFKAFIAAAGKVFVYSTVDAIRTIPGVDASSVAFLANGAFAYLATGAQAV